MREIEFRAKNNKEWVFGCFVQGIDFENKPINNSIVRNTTNINPTTKIMEQDIYNIDINTLGQYTGIKDKNGTKIFEGDIVEYITGKDFSNVAQIIFKDCQFICKDIHNRMITQPAFMNVEFEVIGNIYDNPELLKGE